MAFVVSLDSSGNENNWSSTNLAGGDVTLDTPQNNFANLNLLYVLGTTTPVLTQGNLKFTGHGSDYKTAEATISVRTGAWYWETYFSVDSGSITGFVGIIRGTGAGDSTYPGNDYSNNNVYGISYQSGGLIRGATGGGGTGGEQIQTGLTTYAAGDIIGCAVDIPSGTITWYKNGTEVSSSAQTGMSASYEWMPAIANYDSTEHATCNFGQNGTFNGAITAGGNSDANDIGDFKYSVPSGYLALCSKNIADPTIAQGTDHFNTVLYTGNAGTNAITGAGFQPDLVWTKVRNAVGQHSLFDAVRGATKRLTVDTTAVESTVATSLTSFDSDGFTFGNEAGNNSGETYAAWNWKAGGAPTADNSAAAAAVPTAGSVKIDGANFTGNLAGTIAATRLSANTTSAFSIVKYNGNDTAGATVAHGLSAAPELVIVKSIDCVYGWDTTTPELGTTGDTTGGLAEYYMVRLDHTMAKADWGEDNIFGLASTTFSVGTGGNMNEVNNSSYNYVAYCFGEVEGYSKVGSYIGNGSTNGTFVHTGFRPAYVLAKKISAVGSWVILDNKRNTYNVANSGLWPDGTWAEESADTFRIDLLSNGFKWRNDQSGMNASGADYIYLAFAKAPFKYANAR